MTYKKSKESMECEGILVFIFSFINLTRGSLGVVNYC